MSKQTIKSNLLKIKDPGSAITHFIAMALAILAAGPLLIKAAKDPGQFHVTALAVFIVSMILLYAASTTYHTLDISPKINQILRKLDHMMIFILIAGSYTPVCLIALHGRTGTLLCAAVWAAAIFGILVKAFWINCPKWFSSLSRPAFGWLLAGGIIYTVGGIIYALKLPIFNNRHKNFGSHEIFHLFVMAGSFCHFIVMYFFVAPMPV